MGLRRKFGVAIVALGVALAVLYYFVAAREQITFYQTYGYQQGGEWVVPIQLRAWERGLWDRAGERLIASAAQKGEALAGREFDRGRFRSRIAAFAEDNESGQQVAIAFDEDPDDARYPIVSADGQPVSSDNVGHLDGQIRIPVAVAATLLKQQASDSGFLTYHAVSSGHTGKGRLRLIEDDPNGLSVVSDIDDTIKITEVPAGHRVLYLNTFVREFKSADGMAERYKQWPGAAFHYVSGGPWQLYEPLFEFLPKQGFPDGSVHMRNLPLHIGATEAGRLIEFIFDKQATARHKVARIRDIMTRFPSRQFILVGDSGEADPEVYREIKADPRLGDRVQAIFIRVVTDSPPSRLAGMTAIEAPRVLPDVSQFDAR